MAAAAVVNVVIVAVVRLVLLEAAIAAVGLAAMTIAPIATVHWHQLLATTTSPLLLQLLLLLLLTALDDHVEGDGVLRELQLRGQLLLLGLELMEDCGGLGTVSLLEEVGLLEDVELKLLHEVGHLPPGRLHAVQLPTRRLLEQQTTN
jgi:hypothetical protein